jgi:SAM domain (Sterile alpha motif)
MIAREGGEPNQVSDFDMPAELDHAVGRDAEELCGLRGLGLGQYAPVFRDNNIDGEVLPEVSSSGASTIMMSSHQS